MSFSRIILLFHVFLLLPATQVHGQPNEKKLVSIFDHPFRTLCVIGKDSGPVKSCKHFPFSDEYSVGASMDDEQRVLQVGLGPKDYPVRLEHPIFAEEKRSFLTKLATIHKFGRLQFSGEGAADSAHAKFWEIYDRAFVLAISGRVGESKFGQTHVFVYFPTKVTGRIATVEKMSIGKDHLIYVVHIDGCSYMSLEKKLTVGKKGTFRVVGPPTKTCTVDESQTFRTPADG